MALFLLFDLLVWNENRMIRKIMEAILEPDEHRFNVEGRRKKNYESRKAFDRKCRRNILELR